MRYYYDYAVVSTNDYKYLDKLQDEIVRPLLNKFIKAENLDQKNLQYLWTSKNTFGFVLADYSKKEGKTIGTGEKALYEQLRDKYDFVILTKNISNRKYDEMPLPSGKQGIKINIDYFQSLLSKTNGKTKTVELFLSKPTLNDFEKDAIRKLFSDDPAKLEELVGIETIVQYLEHLDKIDLENIKKITAALMKLSQNTGINNFENLEQILKMATNLLNNYKVTNVAEFESIGNFLIDSIEKYDLKEPIKLNKFENAIAKILDKKTIATESDFQEIISISNTTERSITRATDYFEKILKEFHDKIHSSEDEIKIRDFIYENIWLLDFKYYDHEKDKEKSIDSGNVDLRVFRNHLGINSVIVAEFKRADAETTTIKDRGEDKPAILSNVGRALSQTIHYIEEMKKTYPNVEGIVIIGKRKESKDYFIDKFNQYLHGIKIKTFDELHSDALSTVEVFKKFNQRNS